MAIFWLKGVVGGKPPFCFLLEVANCWGVMASDYNGSFSPGNSSIGNLFGDKEHDTISIAPAASVAPSVPGVDLDFRDSEPASSARVNFERSRSSLEFSDNWPHWTHLEYRFLEVHFWKRLFRGCFVTAVQASYACWGLCGEWAWRNRQTTEGFITSTCCWTAFSVMCQKHWWCVMAREAWSLAAEGAQALACSDLIMAKWHWVCHVFEGLWFYKLSTHYAWTCFQRARLPVHWTNVQTAWNFCARSWMKLEWVFRVVNQSFTECFAICEAVVLLQHVERAYWKQLHLWDIPWVSWSVTLCWRDAVVGALQLVMSRFRGFKLALSKSKSWRGCTTSWSMMQTGGTGFLVARCCSWSMLGLDGVTHSMQSKYCLTVLRATFTMLRCLQVITRRCVLCNIGISFCRSLHQLKEWLDKTGLICGRVSAQRLEWTWNRDPRFFQRLWTLETLAEGPLIRRKLASGSERC